MKRALVFLCAVIATAAVLGTRWLESDPVPTPAPTAVEETDTDRDSRRSVASGPPAPPAERETRTPEPEPDASGTRHREFVRSDPVLRERARQQELAAAADARWEQGASAYSADDLDPAIRELFTRVDLAPRYAEGGRIEGLVIRDMASDHPLAAAGFRSGDLIDRIQGTPLSDPADLPSLLAHLGPKPTFCASREGTPLCRELELD